MAYPAPDNPIWHSNNHQFASIPPNVQGYIWEQLRLPSVHAETLLPPHNMSVIDFVYSFSLPSMCKNPADYNIPDGHCFFSCESHTADVSILAWLTVPPRTVLAILVKDRKQAWLNGSSSISLPGEQTYLPMWAPQFWSELHLTIEPAHTQWRSALEWLKRNEFQSFQDQIRATLHSLSTLSWFGNLNPQLPGKTAFVKSNLQVFLSRNWLNSEHIDQLTYLLKRDIQEQDQASDVHQIDTILARKLLLLYDAEKNCNQLYLPEGDHFWQVFGKRLGPTSRVGGVFHVNGNHWVTAVVDIAMEELAYGDPLAIDGSPYPEIKSALLWFISKHVTSFDPATTDDECLSCPAQSLLSDWFNCGIFSHNSLLHAFLRNPILQHTHNPVVGDLERLHILCRLISTHNAMLSEICSLDINARSSKL